MNKKILLCLCLTLTAALAFPQKQANIWYFGKMIGLDFNPGDPIPLFDSKANAIEGASTIADNNGNLLFYTNGNVIMNRAHKLMKNGGNLLGNLSSTNNTVIIPLPGNDSLYYIFTTSAANEEEQKFLYSIVNMNGDGGMGEAISKNNIIESVIFEKIAAVRHCNNRDAWVVVRKWDSDEYHAYLFTANGLDPAPVISNTGLYIAGIENNAIGTLKFSKTGDKLCAVHSFQNDKVELMDFDKNTGLITNPIVFGPNASGHQVSFPGSYGAEFSPNGRLLYVSANNSQIESSVVYQFDISSGNPATILASKQLIHQNSKWYAGALQAGPDGRIYMAMWQDSAVSVIDAPDVPGPGCNFRFNKIDMGSPAGEPVQFGLNTILQSYLDPASNPYDFSRTGNCADRNVSFVINRLSGIDSVKWDFGDGNRSQSLAPTNNYAAPGFYNVQLIVYKVDCSGLYDTIRRSIWIADKTMLLGNDTASCSSLQLNIGVDPINGAHYLWSNDSLTNRITAPGSGLYWIQISQNGCTIRDTILISLLPPPTVNLGKDTSLCKYKGIVLSAAVSNGDAYLWNTGETTASIYVDVIGDYNVRVTRNGCVAYDTVSVSWGDCDIYLPSAFTPNDDKKNDYFGVLNGSTFKRFSLQVFNRAGQTVFSTSNPDVKWDGTYKKTKLPFGAYVWILEYINKKNERVSASGTVMLIR